MSTDIDQQIVEMLAEREIRNAILRYARGVNRKGGPAGRLSGWRRTRHEPDRRRAARTG